jgi:hypothetical protein
MFPRTEADYRRLSTCIRATGAAGERVLHGKDRLGRIIASVSLPGAADALWRGPATAEDREALLKVIITTLPEPWTLL